MSRIFQSAEHAEIKPRKRIQGLAQPCQNCGAFLKFFPNSTEHGTDARGLRAGNLQKPFITSPFGQECHDAPDGFIGREFAGFSSLAKEVQQGSVCVLQARPGFGPAGVNNGFSAKQFARNASRGGGNFALVRSLRRKSEEIRSGNARWKNVLALRDEPLNNGRVGAAFAKGRLAGAVVDALAQTLKCAFARQARQRLGGGGEGKILEVLEPPEALAFRLNAAPDDRHNTIVATCFGAISSHQQSFAW